MARGHSFAYTTLVCAITFVITMPLWGLMHSEVVPIVTGLDAWMADNSVGQQVQEWILISWDWYPLFVILGIGIEALIASRLPTASGGNIILRSIGLFGVNLIMVIWAFVFPNAVDPLIKMMSEGGQFASEVSPFEFAFRFAVEVSFAYGPIALLITATSYYLLAPIRLDAIARGAR